MRALGCTWLQEILMHEICETKICGKGSTVSGVHTAVPKVSWHRGENSC